MGITLASEETRTVGIGALIMAIGAGMTSNLLFLAAFQFRVDWFLEPSGLIGGGATSAEFLRWASALDLVGYYLATGALAYVLWRRLRVRRPLIADLTTIAAISYTLAGGVGAAVLATTGPALMHEFAAAGPMHKTLIASQFAVLIEVVWRGIWQFLDAILLAIWWLGLGLLLSRDTVGLSRLSFVLSFCSGVGAMLNLLNFDLARDLLLGVVFTLWTTWWIWLLVIFIRSRGEPPDARYGHLTGH